MDEIKIGRRGSTSSFDPEAFQEAGLRARRALDAGRNVVVVELFNRDDLVALALGPTGFDLGSPELATCWLACDVDVAVRRKRESLPENVVRDTHAVAARRTAYPGEIVLDTTSETQGEVVGRLVEALAARGNLE